MDSRYGKTGGVDALLNWRTGGYLGVVRHPGAVDVASGTYRRDATPQVDYDYRSAHTYPVGRDCGGDAIADAIRGALVACIGRVDQEVCVGKRLSNELVACSAIRGRDLGINWQ